MTKRATMTARHLAPKKLNAARYPLRELVEERAVRAIEDAIEEIVPRPGSWLIVSGGGRSFHYEGDRDRWKFRQMVLQKDES